MDRKVIWSHEVASDMEAVADYIAKDSPSYAAAFIRKILDVGNSLNKHSERGRIVPEYKNPTIREVFVRDYRLIYQVQKSYVKILTLIHGSRDLARWIGKQ